MKAIDELNRIRHESSNPTEVGRGFESLFCNIAEVSRELEIDEIYPISKWPDAKKYGLDARDIGVDLVGKMKSGDIIAIQCKAHKSKISKDDVKDFLSGSLNKVFSSRWLVTTSEVGEIAQQMLVNANAKIIYFDDYHEVELDKANQPSHKLWDLQEKAVKAVIDGFSEQPQDEGRGRLVMACGTGKTFTSLRIAEEIVEAGKLILFLAPSISLVAQARREWLKHTCRDMHCTVICSDSTVTSGEKNLHREILSQLSCPVTTDAKSIAESILNNKQKLKERNSKGVSVVFCTYQSVDKLKTAQKEHNAPKFDLAIIDEAHRTAGLQKGDEARMFQKIHQEDSIHCRKRLYMTATPRIYSDKSKTKIREKNQELSIKSFTNNNLAIIDMSDEKIYGPLFYRISFKQAIEAGKLSDIRIIALGLEEDKLSAKVFERLKIISNSVEGLGGPPDIQEYISAVIMYMAIIDHSNGQGENWAGKLSRTIAYSNTIRKSKWLCQAIKEFNSGELRGLFHNTTDRDVPKVEAVHLDASSSAAERQIELKKLNNTEEEECLRVISNVKLFSEGVDVPSLSSIAFLNSRDSEIDIIQSIGRVMRKPPDGQKEYGYIIVPFYLQKGEEVIDALTNKSPRFETLGKVLRALMAHDEDLKSTLDQRLLISLLDYEDKNTNTTDKDKKHEEHDDETEKQLNLFALDNLEGIYPAIANYSGLSNRGNWIADIIIHAVKRVALIFKEEGVDRTLAIALGASSALFESMDEKELEAKLKDATHTASLVLINACLMHKRLASNNDWDNQKFKKLEDLTSKKHIIHNLIESWQTILDYDYKPIFEQALMLLNQLNAKHSDIANINMALRILVTKALETAEELNELGYDHAGSLYHKILENASSQGAFYTKNISAVILAKLLFNEEFTDWSNNEKVTNLKILDPSCGTGTLLMASLNTIKNRVTDAQQDTGKEITDLHKDLVENSIHGFDINHQAIQLAACNLTLGDPKARYNKIGLYTLKYGYQSEGKVSEDNVNQGAIEILLHSKDKSKDIHGSMEDFITLPVTTINTEREEQDMPKVSGLYDAIIMNPPYTETPKQKRQFPQVVGKAMSGRLKKIKEYLANNNPTYADALAKNTLRPFFGILAESLLHSENGALGKLMPTTACTARSSLGERHLLVEKFHIECIITSHHPKDFAFSVSTDIHESILIARRNTKGNKAPTKFIQLAHMPKELKEVDDLVKKITTNNLGAWGNIIELPYEKVAAGDWSPVQWYNQQLVDANNIIKNHKKLRPYSKESSYPVAGSSFRSAFDYYRNEASNDMEYIDRKEKYKAFCSISQECGKTMARASDSIATIKTGKERVAQRLLANTGHILIPERIDVATAKMTAIYAKKPSMGSAYMPLASKDKIDSDTAKALVAFLNSSFGILQLFNIRAKKMSYLTLEITSLKNILYPDLTLDLSPLTEVFDRTVNQELHKIQEANKDPIRKELDYAVAKLIGVKSHETDKWREFLANEPILSRKEATSRPEVTSNTEPFFYDKQNEKKDG